jgi:hypothetical protein
LEQGEVRVLCLPLLLKYLIRFVSSDAPILAAIIQDMHKYGLVYYAAIDMSIQAAEAGYAFSAEAIDLCHDLLDTDTNLEDLQEYIISMKDVARQAHQSSKAAVDKYNYVRQGIFEVRSHWFVFCTSETYFQVPGFRYHLDYEAAPGRA